MSCTIYLVRHGLAGPPPKGGSDADRTLTEEGRRRMRRIAQALVRLGVRPAAILTSPLARAVETGQVLADRLGQGAASEVLRELGPDHTPEQLVAELKIYQSAPELMLVGHEPGLSRLASLLLAGSADAVALLFKKGSVAAIDLTGLPPRSPGLLRWLLAPKQLRFISA